MAWLLVIIVQLKIEENVKKKNNKKNNDFETPIQI